MSRVTPVQTAMRNCTRDEGRSFEVRQSGADLKPPSCRAHGAITALQHPDTTLVWLGSKASDRRARRVLSMSALPPIATELVLAAVRRLVPLPVVSRCSKKLFAVGTRVTSRPPPRSVRAAFPHTAPTSGIDGNSVP